MKNLKMQALLLCLLSLSATNMLAPFGRKKKATTETAQPAKPKMKRYWWCCGGNIANVATPGERPPATGVATSVATIFLATQLALAAIADREEEDFILSPDQTFGRLCQETAGEFMSRVSQSYFARLSLAGRESAEPQYDPVLSESLILYFNKMTEKIFPNREEINTENEEIIYTNIERLLRSSLVRLASQIRTFDESIQKNVPITLVQIWHDKSETDINNHMALILLEQFEPAMAATLRANSVHAAGNALGSRRGSRISVADSHRLTPSPRPSDLEIAAGVGLASIGLVLGGAEMTDSEHSLPTLLATIAGDAVTDLVSAAVPEGPLQNLALVALATGAAEISHALTNEDDE